VLSLGESQEQECLMDGTSTRWEGSIRFLNRKQIPVFFFLCWRSRAVYISFFKKKLFYLFLDKQNCTKEALDLSQLVVFPLRSKWAS